MIAPLHLSNGFGTVGEALRVASSGYAARRALGMASIPLPINPGAATNISGTTSQSHAGASIHAYAFAAAATAGVSRIGWDQGLMSSLFTGGAGWFGDASPASSWAKKWRFEFAAAVCLSAHADSQVSLHFGLTNVATTPARAAEEGVSILFVGGASAGTVAIYSHNGSAGSTSATAAFAIGDKTMHLFALEWEPGVGFRFYVDGVLACTMTANLPSGAGTAAGHETWFLINNTANGVTHPTGIHLWGGTVHFFA